MKIYEQPIFFEQNRVYRIYLGGKQYDTLFKDGSDDCLFPEEWIASNVKAINPKYFGERDGVSVVKGTDVFFDDLLIAESEKMLGGKRFDCLVKFLDSAIRLPVQVHPTKEFSKKNFGSPYGKTEAWLVIATREDAKIYFGFNREMTKDELSKTEEDSLDDKDAMQKIVYGVTPKVGDLYLINAGLIHAIGAGCTIVEIQEPTDFTIQPENWCGDIRISEQEKYIGLTKSTALDCFNLSMVGQKAVDSAKVNPKITADTDGYKREELITYDDTTCFALNRHFLTSGSVVLDNAPAVYIALEGTGKIEILGNTEYQKDIKSGDYFFLPFCLQNKVKVSGNFTLIECLPSKQ